MDILRKTLIAGAALATVGAAVVATFVPASAAPGVAQGHALRITSDWTAEAPNVYEGPGSYDSLADYTRSIEGTPCGMECTRDHQIWRNRVR